MYSKKLKGIWPLYGGARNYVLTLRKILGKVNQENPTRAQLALWLMSEYQVSSNTVPFGVLRVVSKCLGFIQDVHGRVTLTPVAEEFLKTGKNNLVLEALQSRVIGFDEILSMLGESQPLSLMEIHKGLLEKCKLDWTTTTQTMYRLNWLTSLNLVVKEYGKYRLSGKDLGTAEEKRRQTPTPPPTPPRHETIRDTNFSKSLSNADRLSNLGMYDQAIREYGSVIERLLKKLYQNYFPNLPIQCKEKILNYERQSKMPINKFTIGQWIGLFRSADLFRHIAHDRKGKGESFVFFVPSILDNLNKLRNKSTHSTPDIEHYINKDSAFFAKSAIICILRELGE